MSKESVSLEEKKARVQKPEKANPPKQHAEGPSAEASLAGLQQIVGNRAVQRLLAQRSGDDSYELDDQTASQIDQERGAGQSLDSQVQDQMSSSFGYNFDDVRVHNSPKSDALNQQLSAEAFTTGNDVFFRQGAYNPGSSEGKQLIAHELTHVVQQSSGEVNAGGSGTTVGAPHDAFEQEADQSAQQVVQRQMATEEDKLENSQPTEQTQTESTAVSSAQEAGQQTTDESGAQDVGPDTATETAGQAETQAESTTVSGAGEQAAQEAGQQTTAESGAQAENTTMSEVSEKGAQDQLEGKPEDEDTLVQRQEEEKKDEDEQA